MLRRMSFAVKVSREDIEQYATRGKRNEYLWRRVRIGVPFDAWGTVKYSRQLEREHEDVEEYIARYLTRLISQLDTTDYLREWLDRESPIEIPVGSDDSGIWNT